MTCERVSDAGLSGYADSELPPEQQRWWEQHLAQCPACRADWLGCRALSAALKRQMPPREPLVRLPRRLAPAAPARSRAARPRRRIPLPRWGAALAAGLVFAVGFGLGTGKAARAPATRWSLRWSRGMCARSRWITWWTSPRRSTTW